jgi:DNA-binding response OmpR family regulator
MAQQKALILLIDTDAQLLEARRTQLKEAGYEVLTARTGKKGLALFVAGPVDLAMVGYQMPDMAGEFVAAWIKTINPRVPIVMFTPRRRPSKRQRRYVDVFLSAADSWPQILTVVDKLLKRTMTFWDRWWREWRLRISSGPRKPQPMDCRLPEWWRSG